MEVNRTFLQIRIRQEKSLKDDQMEKEDKFMKNIILGEPQQEEDLGSNQIIEISTSKRYKYELDPNVQQVYGDDYDPDDDY